MTDWVVTARHQVERGGKMYSPRQVVPGVSKNDPDDLALIEAGLLSEVKRDIPTTKPAAKKITKSPIEEKKD